MHFSSPQPRASQPQTETYERQWRDFLTSGDQSLNWERKYEEKNVGFFLINILNPTYLWGLPAGTRAFRVVLPKADSLSPAVNKEVCFLRGPFMLASLLAHPADKQELP